MRGMWITGISASLLLAGCADMLADQALRDAEAKCEKMGMRFVQDKVDKTELVVISAAKVSGRCVPPEEPPQK